WYRIFRGFELDDEGFERMREAQNSGPLLLLPCHRSHIDYLILSWLMDRYHLPIPHIAAGQNLSFFPMGPIFRRGGAFFIKRSFKGNKLYKTVLLEYLARLFNEGINVEFFPEGTRSRTGKAVYPKQGLLSMIAELLAQGKIPSPQIVPISIGYEKVIEENAYQQELKGVQKKSEDFLQVIKAGKVVLNRYGRVNIRVGTPFDMKSFMGSALPGTPEFASRIEELALTVISSIIENTLVTSSMLTAAALLCSGHDHTDKGEAFSRFLFFRRIAISMDAHLASTLTDEKDQLRRFNKSLKSFGNAISQKENTIHIHRGRRSQLAYYRNGFLQVIAPLAIYSLATQFGSGAYIMFSYLWDGFLREFPQLNLLDRESERLNQAARYAEIADDQKIYLGFLLPDLLEGQIAAISAMAQMEVGTEVPRKVLMTAMIHHGNQLLGEGKISRPEGLNRSIYGEALELMLFKGLLQVTEKGIICRSTETLDELSLEADARKKLLEQIPQITDQ
ncbi:glycerol-3-phosphate acyltransferase, partial [Myxococcota bacterium]|nr:glycerol-3-phosphate acyltransferase [Myxococcota bacterium]